MSLPDPSFRKKSHDVRNGVSDSTRWDGFVLRDDDVIIASWSKAGTTWTQQLITQLILGAPDALTANAQITPWLDSFLEPLPAVIARLEAQRHRRLIKTHLPASALTISPKVKYVYVGRDVRDIIWSAHNHVLSFSDQARARMGSDHGAGREPIADVREYYHDFLDGGPSAQGPAGQLFEHVGGWWALRNLPNLLFVHFANLKRDLEAETRRLAAFLEIPLSDELLDKVLEHSSFEYMRAAAGPDPTLKLVFKDGARSFFHKGTNGRWRDVLSDDEVAKADRVAAAHLPQDCAHWLRLGKSPI